MQTDRTTKLYLAVSPDQAEDILREGFNLAAGYGELVQGRAGISTHGSSGNAAECHQKPSCVLELTPSFPIPRLKPDDILQLTEALLRQCAVRIAPADSIN